ncbi:MAG: cytochrome P450 [Halioglobus sp.]
MTTHRITGFREVEEAYRRPELKQALYNEGGILFDKVLVDLHGDEHRTRRSIESRLFRRNFFRQYEAEVFPRLMHGAIERYLLKEKMDFRDLGYRIMLNVALAFAGIDRQDNSDEEADTLHQLLSQLGLAATLGQYQGDKEPVKEEIRAALSKFQNDFFIPAKSRREALIEQFKAGAIEESDLPRDILTVLMTNDEKLKMPDELMMREVAFFYLASAHTSVHTMTHAIHEVFTWFERNDGEATSLSDDPLTLQKFVLESMRLHPASPEGWRETDQEVTLTEGKELRVGDDIVLDLQAANRDKDVFGVDAAEYNPFRDRVARTSPAGLSFGGGIHVCLGMNLVAGTLLKTDAEYDPENHQYGTITLILREMLRRGASPDPDQPPRKQANTLRDVWEIYPLQFTDIG